MIFNKNIFVIDDVVIMSFLTSLLKVRRSQGGNQKP